MAYIEREVEYSVPELKLGNLLQNSEIRQIVKQRTFYADRKFIYTKHDFLRYIQFENKLFRLVMLRAQTKPNLEVDVIKTIRRKFIGRINAIYNVALDRFGNDKQLWLLSFDFAKRYSERISRSKFLKALQLHPNWINAWIEAAEYEYKWNKNPMNARLLYQRAIAMNPKSPSLYLSFFKLELNVIKEHLNWNLNDIEHKVMDKDFNWKKELDAFNQDKSESDDQDASKKQDEWLDVIYSQMEVPKLIFRFALQNIDGDLKYVVIKKCLLLIPSKQQLKSEQHELVKVLSSKEKKLDADELEAKINQIVQRFSELSKYMFEYLEKHYYNDAVIIQMLARKNLHIYSKHNTVFNRSVEMAGCQVFERAVLLLSIADHEHKAQKREKEKLSKQERQKFIVEILNGYVKYIRDRMNYFVKLKKRIVKKRDDEEEEELNKHDLYLLQLYDEVMNYLVLRLLESFRKLVKLSATNASMFQDWILLLTQINRLDEALNVIKTAVKQYPENVNLWKLYSNLHCRRLVMAGDDKEEMNNHYRKALAACIKGIHSVSKKDAAILWLNMIDIMIGQLVYLSTASDNDGSKNDEKAEAEEEDDDMDSDIDMEEAEKNGKSPMVRKQVEAIHGAFRKGISECLSNNDGLKETYLQWMVMYHADNKAKQLEVLEWFETQTMRCSPHIYKVIFDIYDAILLFGKKKKDTNTLRKVSKFYEKGVGEHGKNNADVWVWYVEWSRKHRKVSVTSSLHQRAMKTLNSDGLQMFLQRINSKG